MNGGADPALPPGSLTDVGVDPRHAKLVAVDRSGHVRHRLVRHRVNCTQYVATTKFRLKSGNINYRKSTDFFFMPLVLRFQGTYKNWLKNFALERLALCIRWRGKRALEEHRKR